MDRAGSESGLGRPVDAFGLDLDGVDLLAGASEEPLERVVSDLLGALIGLGAEGDRLAHLSLPEAHLELLLRRRGAEVELRSPTWAAPRASSGGLSGST